MPEACPHDVALLHVGDARLALEVGGATLEIEQASVLLDVDSGHLAWHRLDPWPDCFARTAEALSTDGYVYNLMNGPSEFHCIGTIKEWDITARLHEIRTPTLLLSGRYDEATPAIVEGIHRRIPGSEWILFEESSHTPHLEEPAAFNAAVRGFLAGLEARG